MGCSALVQPNYSIKPTADAAAYFWCWVAMIESRKSQLSALIHLSRPLPEITSGLSAFGWDSDESLVILSPSHVVGILGRYLSGELSAADVESWANAVEVREDIECSPESIAGLAIFDLANPAITQPLTRQSANAMVARLSGVATQLFNQADR